MKTFLQAHGYDVWKSVVTGYTATKKPKTATKKELKRNNKIAMDFIWEGLPDLVREKVGKCSSAKELWDKLHNLYSKESPITESDPIKESAGTEQEERCSSCQTDSEEEDCEEGIVDLEAELISALDELTKERKKNKSLEEQLVKKNSQESSKESQQVIVKLKSQLEEARKIEETYKSQMEEKQCLEAKIATLRKEAMEEKQCLETERKEAEKRENILTDHLKERTEDLNQLEAKFGQEERRLEK
jgi:chromosome segregation ATPase